MIGVALPFPIGVPAGGGGSTVLAPGQLEVIHSVDQDAATPITFTVPANTLADDGDQLLIVVSGLIAEASVFTLTFGGSTIVSVPTGAEAKAIMCWLRRLGSSSQATIGMAWSQSSGFSVNRYTTAHDLTAAQNLVATAGGSNAARRVWSMFVAKIKAAA